MAADDVVFRQLKLGPMQNFSYVFGSRGSGEAAVVDPGFEPDRLLAAVAAEGLKTTHVLVTHSHPDHVAALPEVVKRTGARVVGHPRSPVRPDIAARDGARLHIAGVDVVAVHAPGHCPDLVAFVVGDRWLVTGDALFIGECGRVDLPGSNVEAMWRTLNEVLPNLARHLVVCPGHDYGPAPTRTLAEELELNYTLRPRNLAEFREFMARP